MAEELVEYTTDLLDQGIRTYVIGYNYFGNPLELNAIAENGGTDQQEFIWAGSEETLTNAFNQLLGDIKDCLQRARAHAVPQAGPRPPSWRRRWARLR